MWTIEAREMMLNSINNSTKNGATIELFENNSSLIVIDIEAPASRIENGALIFSEAESLALVKGIADRAQISANGIVLLDLLVPDELLVMPEAIVPGSTVRAKSIVIQ